MGLMARCLVLKAATVKTAEESSGPAVIVTAASGDEVYTAEVWGVHGVYSMPPDGTMGVRLPTDTAERFAPIVATHHYKTPRPTLAKGEVALMATSADGATAGGKVIVRADGTVELLGTGKYLVTWDELNTALTGAFLTALKAHLTAAGDPSAGTLTLDISAAKASSLKTV